MLVSSTALATATAAPLKAATDADPIFEAIEAHKRANEELNRRLKTEGDDQNVVDHLHNIEHATRQDVACTPATSASGLLAVLTYLDDLEAGAFQAGRRDSCFERDDLMNVIISAQDTLRAMAQRPS